MKGLGFSERNIALSVPCSRNTVSKVLKCAKERGISWPLSDSTTDGDLEKLLSPSAPAVTSKRMPDFAYIRKELLKNGVSKKLLWTEYMEDCRQAGDEPLMYSQFCYYIQQDENKRRATMHINRKPAEQVEVDWAGDTAGLIDPYTGETVPVYIFVGVMTYSQYAYVEAFPDEKQQSWIDAHVHMYEYFGGVAKILVPDNCKTAVIHNGGWKDQRINTVYHEMAEHYGTAIIPARVRTPKDKPNAEGTVGNISTWITAALRKEQFFTIAELNAAIRVKLEEFNNRPFQKKERTGENTAKVIDAVLRSKRVEQQSYRACMGLLKLADKYSPAKLEEACKAALSYTPSPSYKSISNMLAASKAEGSDTTDSTVRNNNNTHGITRGAGYYRRTKS